MGVRDSPSRKIGRVTAGNKALRGLKWGVWAYYLDGAIDNGCEEEMLELNRVFSGAELDGTVQNTKSRRRRSRRKRQAEEDEEEEC